MAILLRGLKWKMITTNGLRIRGKDAHARFIYWQMWQVGSTQMHDVAEPTYGVNHLYHQIHYYLRIYIHIKTLSTLSLASFMKLGLSLQFPTTDLKTTLLDKESQLTRKKAA